MQTNNTSKLAARSDSKRTTGRPTVARNAHYASEYPLSAGFALDPNSVPGSERLAVGLQSFDSTNGPFRDHSAEHQLAIAILEMSLREYEQQPASRKGVREWIDDRNGPPPFGFDSVCDYLAVNSDYLRRGLTQWMNALDDGIVSVSPLGSGMRVRHRSKTIRLDRKRNRGN